MAEILAIVASGINVAQFASQITICIVKLKGYWSQVKEAPDDIHQLLLEIDTLDLILCQMQSDQSRNSRVSDAVFGTTAMISVRKSHELCKEGADELCGLVKELAEKIDNKKGWRKKTGCAKVVLKKQEIKRLHRRMKNAIRLLNLAYQCHTSAMIQLQPDIIVARISNAMSPPSATSAKDPESERGGTSDTMKGNFSAQSRNHILIGQHQYWASSRSWVRFLLGSWECHTRYRKSNGNDRVELHAKYTSPPWPPWLSARVLDVVGFQILSGWQFSLRSYRRLPGNHSFFDLAAKGDLVGLQNMLTTGQVSVMDREDGHGQTALHIAAREGRIEVCKLLLDSGSDPLARSDSNQTPLHTITYWASHLTFHHKLPAWDICRLLVSSGADDTLIDDLTVITRRNAPIGLVRYLQQQMYPSYHDVPLSQRFVLATGIRSGGWFNTPDLIRLALGGDLDENVTTYKDHTGQTLLHHIARRWGFGDMGRNFRYFRQDTDESSDAAVWRRPFDPENQTHPWRTLLRDIVSTSSPLNPTDDHGRTPLCNLIRESIFLYSGRDFTIFRRLPKTLNIWLVELHRSGMDLQKYGEQEMALHLRENVNRPVRRNSKIPHRVWISKFLGFCFGQRPQDWHFWFEEPTDALLGQFWTMAEKSEREADLESQDSKLPIPGLWIESIPNTDLRSDNDSESDYGSDCDLDINHGHDPDFDLNRQFEHDSNMSSLSWLRTTQVPAALPLSVQSSLSLHEILPEWTKRSKDSS